MESDANTVTPNIDEYYSGKTIFITGASGFIGKLFVEKILRCCPDIKTIYCLLRPKKGQDVPQRLQQLCESSAFDNLRSVQPDFASKLHAINGDISEDFLGIKESDRQSLEKDVQIIVHSAATVRFDEDIRTAITMNVLAVREMVKLARNMTNLEAFIHVSTAYSNCDREFIEEVVYPSSVEPQQLIDILKWMNDDTLESITPNLIGQSPNTYTFSKKLGEALLVKEGSGLPLVIVRPSIVTAALTEPAQGWVDNINGLGGFSIAISKGVLRTVWAEKKFVADIIPVDITVNVMIASAWYFAIKKTTCKDLILHITSGDLNPFTWGDMEDFTLKALKKIAFDDCFRRPPGPYMRNSRLAHRFWTLMSQVLPAHIVDFALRVLQKKPKMVKLYRRLNKAMATIEYFTNRNWQWTHANLDTLRLALSPKDAKKFNCDVQDIDWQLYTENYIMGTKKYILKEDPSNMEPAWTHQNKLRNIRYFFNITLCITFWRFVMAKTKIFGRVRYFILSLVERAFKLFQAMKSVR